MQMKRILALLLSFAMVLAGCSPQEINGKPRSQNGESASTQSRTAETIATETDTEEAQESAAAAVAASLETAGLESASSESKSPDFDSLDDPDLRRYVEDSIYSDLVSKLGDGDYFVENVETVYISKEYLEELAYNSQENIYFGYTLSELEEQFQGTKFVFTLGENGQTVVQALEEYDDTFDQVIKDVAIGTGVILVCVTVSVVSGGAGAPAVSLIFATSAKSATVMALSSGVISGVSAGVVEGIQTHDFDKALKAAAASGSEGYKWGAFTGAITGGVGEAAALKGATLNGLTMNEAAAIQRETKYPLDVIKQFRSMEQYEICKEAGLTAKMVSGKTALVRTIDLDFVDEATGLTNLQRMQEGLAALDPTGTPYELHHIGQKADSTLAILTRAEHRLGDNHKIWHIFGEESKVHGAGNKWDMQKKTFWRDIAGLLSV